MKEIHEYWHIGQAQILSGKITESDFKRGMIDFIEQYIIKAMIREHKCYCVICTHKPLNDCGRVEELKRGLK